VRRAAALLGLAAFCVVVVAAFWMGSRPSTPAATPVTVPAAASAGSGDDAVPDITNADGVSDAGGVRITVSLEPRPPAALAAFKVRVFASVLASTDPASAMLSPRKLVPFEAGRIRFEMTMPMGEQRYSLVPGPQGAQEAAVVLPACSSGDRRWYATVEGTVAGQPRIARFRLDLARPSPAPAP